MLPVIGRLKQLIDDAQRAAPGDPDRRPEPAAEDSPGGRAWWRRVERMVESRGDANPTAARPSPRPSPKTPARRARSPARRVATPGSIRSGWIAQVD